MKGWRFRSPSCANGLAWRTVYYRSINTAAKVWPELAKPIKGRIEADPSFGYRSVAAVTGYEQEHGQATKGW